MLHVMIRENRPKARVHRGPGTRTFGPITYAYASRFQSSNPLPSKYSYIVRRFLESSRRLTSRGCGCAAGLRRHPWQFKLPFAQGVRSEQLLQYSTHPVLQLCCARNTNTNTNSSTVLISIAFFRYTLSIYLSIYFIFIFDIQYPHPILHPLNLIRVRAHSG